MHIRTISRMQPAKAFNLEQLLFVANGIVGLINSIFGLGNTGIAFLNNLANLKGGGDD